MKKIPHKSLIFIFLFALFVRLYRLGSLPSGFHEDEILTGYVGRFILLNGRDLYNNSWPLLYFNKFGDYYIILPMYLKGLSTFIFGVNEFAVRFPSALLGALAVVPVYGLAGIIFHNKQIARLSAFIIAMSPWHIVLSRASSEGIMGATIFMTAVYLLLVATERKNIKILIGSVVLLLICYLIYHPFRLLGPLVLIPLPFLYKTDKKANQFSRFNIIVFVSFLLMMAITGYIGTTKWGSGRFAQTSIFSELSGVSIKIQEQIYDEGNSSILTAKIFHNKVINYGREFVSQYLSYFSPGFLFINGGKSYAYRVHEQGVLYISFLIFFIAALLPVNLKNVKLDKSNLPYLFYLIAILPIPAAMTVLDSPNVHRSVTLNLALSLVLGYGAFKLSKIKFKNMPLFVIIGALLILESIYAWHQYSRHSDFFNAIYRNDGQKELISYLKNSIPAESPVIMPVQNTMPLYYLFYMNDFDSSYSTRFGLDARINKIRNVTFYDNECPTRKFNELKPPENLIIVDSHNCQFDPERFELVVSIQGRNPLLAFKILKPIAATVKP